MQKIGAIRQAEREELDMQEIRLSELKERIWKGVADAQRARNARLIQQWALHGEEVDKLNEAAKKLRDEIERLENRRALQTPDSGNCVVFQITQGDINQNLLKITEILRAKLIPPEGVEFEVETSTGKRFKTDALHKTLKLRERGEIGRFYKMSGVKAGDSVIWKELSPKKFYLAKVENGAEE